MNNTVFSRFAHVLANCITTSLTVATVKLANAIAKLAAMLFVALFSLNATAQSTGWITAPEHPPVKIRMMATGEQETQNATIQTVLDVELEGDWKTYWRSPGEGGIAPAWDWSDSTNIAAVDWHWPVPKYYEQLGVMTLGYKHHVSFPVTLTLKDANQPAVFRAKLTFPSCTNICVLNDYNIELPITPETLTLDQEAMFLFNQGMSQTPNEPNQSALNGLFWDGAKQQLVVQLTSKQGWETPQILVDGTEVEDDFFSQPQLHIDNHTLTAVFDVSNWFGDVDLLQRTINLTVSDATFAEELTGVVGSKPITYQSSQTGFIAMVGFALLGGLILNIMPCVLPVLGMKLNSVIHSQGASNRDIRLSFLASASGVITSFALLALAMTLLKLGGNAIGWGIQFQNMWFIGFMALVTLLFSVNLLGLFEVQLPTKLNSWMATKGDNSHSGHFVQGMFATLLATPCSAPFLGTAVAYALGASYQELWAIFIALGIGMSAPWLLFAIFPSLIKLLPKPGAWMNTVKIIFGLMMFATSIWLTTLLSAFIGLFPTIVLTLAMVVAVFVWIGMKLGRKVLIPIIAIATLIGGGGLVAGSLTAEQWRTPIVDNLDWQPLSAASIPELVAEGNTVFVNVSADWCITCKANKIGVILQDPVRSALEQQNIVLMEGDWTTPSDSVTQYLQSHGRFGVPFNIVYGPSYPEGIPQPVLLDSDTLIQSIEAAR